MKALILACLLLTSCATAYQPVSVQPDTVAVQRDETIEEFAIGYTVLLVFVELTTVIHFQ